jgi:hypothetical protein
MWNILFHHPWVRIYLVIVGCLSLAAIWDRLRHTPSIEKSSRPGDGRPMTPPGVAEKSQIQGSGRSGQRFCPPADRTAGRTGVKTGAVNG